MLAARDTGDSIENAMCGLGARMFVHHPVRERCVVRMHVAEKAKRENSLVEKELKWGR